MDRISVLEAVLSVDTPYILPEGGIVSKQFRGMLGYALLDMNLPLAEEFASPGDGLLFKFSWKNLDRDFMRVKYNGTWVISEVAMPGSVLRVSIFFSDEKDVCQAEAAIRFLAETGTLRMGRSHSHGFGRFFLDNLKRKRVSVYNKAIESIKIDLSTPCFVGPRTGGLVKGADGDKPLCVRLLEDGMRRFVRWCSGDENFNPRGEVEVIAPVRFDMSGRGRVSLYVNSKERVKTEGVLMSMVSPTVLRLRGETARLFKAFKTVWGVGDFVEFGYGAIKTY